MIVKHLLPNMNADTHGEGIAACQRSRIAWMPPLPPYVTRRRESQSFATVNDWSIEDDCRDGDWHGEIDPTGVGAAWRSSEGLYVL